MDDLSSRIEIARTLSGIGEEDDIWLTPPEWKTYIQEVVGIVFDICGRNAHTSDIIRQLTYDAKGTLVPPVLNHRRQTQSVGKYASRAWKPPTERHGKVTCYSEEDIVRYLEKNDEEADVVGSDTNG